MNFWRPEPIFAGQTVFCLGGGPSLRMFHVEQLRGRRVIATNSAALLGPWADVLCFKDYPWLDGHRSIVEAWPGMVCSTSKRAKSKLPDRINLVGEEIRADFTIGQTNIKHSRSTGHMAVSLAIAMAAQRVVLLGYDCRVVTDETGEPRSHFHDEEISKPPELYLYDFLPAWKGWGSAAARAGAEVMNCTPGSALNEFPHADIADVLADGRP